MTTSTESNAVESASFWALRHYLEHPELRKIQPDSHFLATVCGDVERLMKQLKREWATHYPHSDEPQLMIDFGEVVWR